MLTGFLPTAGDGRGTQDVLSHAWRNVLHYLHGDSLESWGVEYHRPCAL